jgi:hypothetical protein
MEVFVAEEWMMRRLKAQKHIRRLTNYWISYSGPKQDRWHRNEEDIKEFEPLDGSVNVEAGYIGDGSLAFGYSIDMQYTS